MARKNPDNYQGDVIVRVWMSVPLKAKNLEEAVAELQTLRPADVLGIDGNDVADWNITHVGVSNNAAISKMDS